MKYGHADIAFSRYVRARDSAHGRCTCPLCLWRGPMNDFTCGHFIKRRHLSTRWYEDNAFAICPECNLRMENDNSMLNHYGQWIAMEIGPERWSKLMKLRLSKEKFTQAEVDDKAKYYREKIKML